MPHNHSQVPLNATHSSPCSAHLSAIAPTDYRSRLPLVTWERRWSPAPSIYGHHAGYLGGCPQSGEAATTVTMTKQPSVWAARVETYLALQLQPFSGQFLLVNWVQMAVVLTIVFSVLLAFAGVHASPSPLTPCALILHNGGAPVFMTVPAAGLGISLTLTLGVPFTPWASPPHQRLPGPKMQPSTRRCHTPTPHTTSRGQE